MQWLPMFAQQEPISFRSQALGGIINDDLDLIYDPIELRFVEGLRLYTNLSNLTSGQEQMLNGISDNEFLIGVSTKVPGVNNLRTSLLIRYRNARFSNPVTIDADLNGTFDQSGQGQLRDIYNAFLDTNFDGLYDIRQTIDQEKTDFSFDKGNVYILNTNWQFSGLTVGARLSRGNLESKSTTASINLGSSFGQLIGVQSGDPTFSVNFTRTILENQFTDFQLREGGDFLSRNTRRFTTVNLAAMRPIRLMMLDTVEMRLDLGYLNETIVLSSDDVYSGSIENFHQDILDYQDAYQESDQGTNGQSQKGSGLSIGLSLKRVFQKAPQRKDDGYWKVSLGWQRKSHDFRNQLNRIFSSREVFFDGIDTLQMDYDDAFSSKMTIDDSGKEKLRDYFLSAIVNIPFDNRVYAGLGLHLISSSTKRNLIYSNTFHTEQNYEQVDDTTNGLDFTRTEDQALNADHTYEVSTYAFIFPVGVEYKFTGNRKWSLRFGSVFSYIRTTTNDAIQVTNSSPYTVIVQRGDGSEDVEVQDNIYQSTSRHTKQAESQTTFFYGLGYTPTDNLQIDLLGFLGTDAELQIFDAEFFRSLRLSFTLKM
ncbi:MAG: hypothetical protein D6732_28770 [Methanobacteriota archaeon]|nr:MAG: hypothetical protein D6732_28770 [Euryarchaeota archaeon]